ncbi:hypothetical protein Q9314_03015 [Shinella sumterensis]|uniref:Uncharacterized protein n=1 Tax=Rhizobium subbaraonis TaxID=908946 RepID=A0A285USG8_9HYPH|nr:MULTISPECIES: hypothetical protein [Rhizobiaceae]MCW5711719.1 hypothetical protein [Shinella sp.]WLS08767.1 hypothetical protein Q9314_03015 [Shinella sumterensis]SOC44790.1 hypothetical protein SAMN05892877_113104 [Rhizobium subbaraonis]
MRELPAEQQKKALVEPKRERDDPAEAFEDNVVLLYVGLAASKTSRRRSLQA